MRETQFPSTWPRPTVGDDAAPTRLVQRTRQPVHLVALQHTKLKHLKHISGLKQGMNLGFFFLQQGMNLGGVFFDLPIGPLTAIPLLACTTFEWTVIEFVLFYFFKPYLNCTLKTITTSFVDRSLTTTLWLVCRSRVQLIWNSHNTRMCTGNDSCCLHRSRWRLGVWCCRLSIFRTTWKRSNTSENLRLINKICLLSGMWRIVPIVTKDGHDRDNSNWTYEYFYCGRDFTNI